MRRRSRLERWCRALAPLLFLLVAGVLSMGIVRVVEHATRPTPNPADQPWEPEMPAYRPLDVLPPGTSGTAQDELHTDDFWQPSALEPDFDLAVPPLRLPATPAPRSGPPPAGLRGTALEPIARPRPPT